MEKTVPKDSKLQSCKFREWQINIKLVTLLKVGISYSSLFVKYAILKLDYKWHPPKNSLNNTKLGGNATKCLNLYLLNNLNSLNR